VDVTAWAFGEAALNERGLGVLQLSTRIRTSVVISELAGIATLARWMLVR
jgi:hypothetical protein